MNEQILAEVISNSIITTAILANEMCIQSNGLYILPEVDYLYYVKDFQFKISRRLMPIKNQEDLKLEAKAYISEIIKTGQEKEHDANRSGEAEI